MADSDPFQIWPVEFSSHEVLSPLWVVSDLSHLKNKDAMQWKHFLCHRSFLRGIHGSPVNGELFLFPSLSVRLMSRGDVKSIAIYNFIREAVTWHPNIGLRVKLSNLYVKFICHDPIGHP